MPRLVFPLLSSLLLTGPLAPAVAQLRPGDGLRGDYYIGRNFEHFAASRRDAVIDFNWNGHPPLSNMPIEDFSVRWTGWLVPPVTGEYVLRVTVDDGARIWLNGKQLLDEWRGQEPTTYQVRVQLSAGHSYRLRFDYCQYGSDTRALLSWLPPAGLPDGSMSGAPIPMRYLYSHNPLPPDPTPPAQPTPPADLPPADLPPVAALTHPRPARPTSTAAPAIAPPARRTVTPRPLPAPSRAAALGQQLASGRELTMRTLYFEQGKAFLLPAVQASLDTLAEALRQRPTLRLQVQGHTDNQGDSVLNRHLSQRRAEAVCAYLAAHGVAAERLQPLGLGGRYPVADNSIPTERARNRRVVLVKL